MEVKFLSPQELSSPVFFYCKRAAKKMFTLKQPHVPITSPFTQEQELC